jgi:SSS family solute:Na+ symporter
MEISANSNLVLASLSVYFLSIIGIGLYYSRRSRSTEDFILASHSLSTPFVTGSVVATWLGGAVIIGGATEAYRGGFQSIVWDPWSPVLTLLIYGFFLVAIFRRSRFTTAIDFYIARYDRRVGMVGLTVALLSYVSWISAQLLSLGVIVSVVTGMDTVSATLLGAGIILAISLTGGLWALSRSDMLAFIILTFVLLAVLPYALDSVGGLAAFVDKAGNLDGNPPFSLFYTSELNKAGEVTGFAGYVGLLGFFYMMAAWFSVALGDIGGSALTARALAAKNEKAATRGFVMGGLIYLVLGMIPVIVGMCAYILKANIPEAELDSVFPWFVNNYLPDWIAVLFFVAVASAIVSTAGDVVLTSGALLGYTALKAARPEATDKHCLLATRGAMVVFMLAGLVVALAMGDLYRLLVFAGVIGFPVLAATFLCGVLWKKANVTGALASMTTGALSWIPLGFVVWPYVDGEIWDAIYIAAVSPR